ncbi:MAG: beta-phosphoglucomutase family hydrolase [Dehalococcoidia bacterium]
MTPNPNKEESPEIALDSLDAVIFDMDGVVTDTARVHAVAWKRLFDEYLTRHAERSGTPFEPFSTGDDYLKYVDGKSRHDGIESFLESRGIDIPRGQPGDGPEDETVYGLGNKKNQYFLDLLKEDGAKSYETTVSFLVMLAENGIRRGVISSSRNCAEVLKTAGVDHLFETRVDGVDAGELGLEGKPDPAIFLEAARRLHVEPARSAVIEDALSGVEAGRRGSFALVVGVDRVGQADALREHGADIVVQDLSELRIRQP